MRLDMDYSLWAYCLATLLLIPIVYRKIHRSLAGPVIALLIAVNIPALLPGHGEWVLVLPYLSLLGISGTTAKSISIAYLLGYTALFWFVFNKAFKYRSKQ